MPTVDRLANNGLRYNQFHTTALCSPTRMALLTGRNHHMRQHGLHHGDFDRLSGQHRPAPRERGPAGDDAAVQRLHHRAFRQESRDRRLGGQSFRPDRPLADPSGFDKFYGFMGGETNQWAPAIYDGMTKVEVPKDPNYHFMTDMTNQAINWMQSVKSLRRTSRSSSTSLLGYPCAAPVPKEWIAKYKGKFDQGWDKLREETLPARRGWA